MPAQVALTTFDNPFSPFTQFNEWMTFDITRGYNSSAYLARIARTSPQLSDEENNSEIERAIDEIIKYDIFGVYKKVKSNETKMNETDLQATQDG